MSASVAETTTRAATSGAAAGRSGAGAGEEATNGETRGVTNVSTREEAWSGAAQAAWSARALGKPVRVAGPLSAGEAQAAMQDVAAIRARIRVHVVRKSSTTIVVPGEASAHLAAPSVTTRAQAAAAFGAPRFDFALGAESDSVAGGGFGAARSGRLGQSAPSTTTTTSHLNAASASALASSALTTTTTKKKKKNSLALGGEAARDFNYELCCACGSGGELVCCESCPNAYHFSCTVPMLDPDNLPDGDWFCRHCAAKGAAAALPVPPPRFAYEAVIHALAFVNPIEFTVPPDLADLVAAQRGLDAADRAAPDDNPFFMAPDGDMLAKDRDLCVVCDLPFECDNTIQPAARFDVPSLAGVASRATVATAAHATHHHHQQHQPSAQGLAFLGAVDPYRAGNNERAVPRNYADKRVCAWCDDTYHAYCVRPLSDPAAPVPTHWLCPRHFREPDANFARQKLSRKAHALHQDPKWHRDYLAQRETQARASAAPLLFGALKPSATLRGAASAIAGAPPMGDNVRRVFVTAREQLIDADIAHRPVAEIAADERDLRATAREYEAAALPSDGAGGAASILDIVGAADDELAEPATLTNTTVAALTAAAAAVAATVSTTTAGARAAPVDGATARLSGTKRVLDDVIDIEGDGDVAADNDDASRLAVANLLALFAHDADDLPPSPLAAEPYVAASDRRELAQLLESEHVDVDACDVLSPTFVQFLAWQQLQLLHAKHKEALDELRRKEMKTSTVSNATTHAAPRSSLASRRTQLSSSTSAGVVNTSASNYASSKRRGGMPRTACDNCYVKHYECRVPRDGVACLRCVTLRLPCSLRGVSREFGGASVSAMHAARGGGAAGGSSSRTNRRRATGTSRTAAAAAAAATTSAADADTSTTMAMDDRRDADAPVDSDVDLVDDEPDAAAPDSEIE